MAKPSIQLKVIVEAQLVVRNGHSDSSNLFIGFAKKILDGLRPFAVKTKTSAERDRVVAALRPAPLMFCGLDGLTPLIAAGLVGLHAQPQMRVGSAGISTGLTMSFAVDSRTPKDCSKVEIEQFIALVLKGDEVVAEGLEGRVRRAEELIFLRTEAGQLTGIAALKHPSGGYRTSIAKKTGIELPVALLPYELGWIYVEMDWRKQGLSGHLVESALTAIRGAGVFSTSRADNTPMHRTLERYGFNTQGGDYQSDRGDHRIRLFVRSTKRPEC
jgi:GNAT superfamily N-acetyltransferase